MSDWVCPKCKRRFTRPNQRHACGVGTATDMFAKKAPELVKLFQSLEKHVRALKGVEIVYKDRYALLRTRRIFVDVVFMKDALRMAIHIGREASHPLFFKVGASERHVTHVACVQTAAELKSMLPFVDEAHAHSRRD